MVYNIGRTIGNLLANAKKKKIDRKNVVYRGTCATCGLVYIGETSQWLTNRKAQHQSWCRRKDVKNGFYSHLQKHPDHKIDWENFEIIDPAKNWSRKLEQSILRLINAASDGGDLTKVINLEEGEHIDPCWNSLL